MQLQGVAPKFRSGVPFWVEIRTEIDHLATKLVRLSFFSIFFSNHNHYYFSLSETVWCLRKVFDRGEYLFYHETIIRLLSLILLSLAKPVSFPLCWTLSRFCERENFSETYRLEILYNARWNLRIGIRITIQHLASLQCARNLEIRNDVVDTSLQNIHSRFSSTFFI